MENRSQVTLRFFELCWALCLRDKEEAKPESANIDMIMLLNVFSALFLNLFNRHAIVCIYVKLCDILMYGGISVHKFNSFQVSGVDGHICVYARKMALAMLIR